MMEKPIKAVVWDLDGTLIHFKIDIFGARQVAIDIFQNYGIPSDLLSTRNRTIDNAKIAKDYFKSMGFSDNKINNIMQHANDAISKIEYEAALNATMVKGIDQVLVYIKKKKLKQAIFTYNTQENAKISLEKINLLNYFEVIVGRNDIENPKPHPDHLTNICDKLSVEPNEIVVIGDMGRDIEAALNVNAHSILIYTKLSKVFKAEAFEQAEKIIKPNEIPSKLIKAIEELL